MSTALEQAEKSQDYKRINVKRLTGGLGAEVFGVNLAEPLDDETFEEVRQAWLENNAIFFRDQTLTPEQQIAFAKRFGEMHPHAMNKPIDGHPEITELLKTEDQLLNSGNRWHTDQHYRDRPAKATMLYCHEAPEYGGDTMFANTYLAYEALSEGMKQMLEGIRIITNGDSRRHPTGMTRMERQAAGIIPIQQMDPGNTQIVSNHPLIRTHPESGRKALYVGHHIERFDGMTEEESEPLKKFLIDFATTPERVCRFRWRPGSVAFWDNRCTMHLAVNDYQGQRRRVHKCMVQGDAPF